MSLVAKISGIIRGNDAHYRIKIDEAIENINSLGGNYEEIIKKMQERDISPDEAISEARRLEIKKRHGDFAKYTGAVSE